MSLSLWLRRSLAAAALGVCALGSQGQTPAPLPALPPLAPPPGAVPQPAELQKRALPEGSIDGQLPVAPVPRELGKPEVTAFLTHLAAKRKVAASTQNQALSALLFLYRQVLKVQLDWVAGFERASRRPRLPVVLSKSELGLGLARAEQGAHVAQAPGCFGRGARAGLVNNAKGMALTQTN